MKFPKPLLRSDNSCNITDLTWVGINKLCLTYPKIGLGAIALPSASKMGCGMCNIRSRVKRGVMRMLPYASALEGSKEDFLLP